MSEVATPVPYPSAMEAYPRVRQSLLSTFDSCNFAARLDMRRVGWAMHHHARGSLFHRVAAECVRELVRIGERTIEPQVAVAVLHDLLRQDDVDRECPRCESREIEKGSKDGKRTCGSCGAKFATDFTAVPMREVKDLLWIVRKWANAMVWSPDEIVSVEERLQATVEYPNPLTGGHVERTVTGQLDVLSIDPEDDRHAIVWDWKTAWAVPPESEISTMGYFQQRFYALLGFWNYPSITRITLDERYVRFNEPRTATIHREEMDVLLSEFGALVERFDRAYSENLWSPSPGEHCSYCPAPQRCPIEREDRGAGTIRTQAEAERAARTFLVADATRDQSLKALRAWAKTHGPIPVKHPKAQDRVFGFRRTASVQKPSLDEVLLTPQAERAKLWTRERVSTRFGLMTREEAGDPERKAEAEDAAALSALEDILRERKADEGV